MTHPLEGIRVVELGSYVAVPKTTRLMADWGAEVIKVESVEGDAWRRIGRSWGIPCKEDNNPLFQTENANKKSVAWDLNNPTCMEALLKLLFTADVFVTNIRTQSLQKLGLTYDHLKERYPHLIYAQFTGYGEDGPERNDPAFDSAAFWGKSGVLIEWSREGEMPVNPLPSFGDSASASLLLSGILAAMLQREKTGRGDLVKTSLYASALWCNSSGVVMGQPKYACTFPKKEEGLPNAFSTLYQTKDGDWLILSTSTWDEHAADVFRMLHLDAYLDDPEFMDMERTRAHLPEVIALLRKGFRKIHTQDAVRALTEMDMVHARLLHPNEVTLDEQGWANQYFIDAQLENGEHVILPNTPVRFGLSDSRRFTLAPQLGTDNIQIMKSLGYDEDTIFSLMQGGYMTNQKLHNMEG